MAFAERVGLSFGFLGVQLGLLHLWCSGVARTDLRDQGNDTLLAVPFFTFMGLILERSGMAERICSTRSASCSDRCAAVSPYAVVFGGALLAATTGVGPRR